MTGHLRVGAVDWTPSDPPPDYEDVVAALTAAGWAPVDGQPGYFARPLDPTVLTLLAGGEPRE